jgi:predicted nucleic-acid-binding protein
MYRDVETNDIRFIKTSMLRSMLDNPHNKAISKESMVEVIDKLIETSEIKIICSDEDFDAIFGYAIYRRIAKDCLVLHGFLVKKQYQKLGLFGDFLDKVKHNGVNRLVITLNLKNTSSVIPYLAKKFKLEDARKIP